MKIEIGHLHDIWGTLEEAPNGKLTLKGNNVENLKHVVDLYRRKYSNNADFLKSLPQLFKHYTWAHII